MGNSSPRRRRARLRVRWWIPVAFAVAILWIVFGYRNHIRRQSVVLTELSQFEWAVPAKAVVLLKEESLPIVEKDMQPDKHLNGKRIGVNEKIGEGSILLSDVHPAPGNPSASVEAAVRSGDFSSLNWLPHALLVQREQQADATLAAEDAKNEALPIATNANGVIHANRAGTFKSPLDGWETILRYESLGSIDLETARFWTGHAPTENRPVPGFSIVDNTKYGLVVLTESLSEAAGDPVFRSDGRTFTPESVRTEADASQTLYLFDMREGFDRLQNRRFLVGELVEATWKGVQFPAKALFSRNGTIGVYRKNEDAIVEFVPLPMYREVGGRVYVEPTEDGISLYDEIFLNPTHLKEGEFIE